MSWDVPDLADVRGARVLAVLGDSVTTDHISPGGNIPVASPAGQWLIEHGVAPRDFNSYGARRGNHEVMMRGGFAGIRLRNRMVPGVEGGFTLLLPSGGQTTVFEAAMAYQDRGTPAIVIAGKEYGTGSSRDWAAKAPRLLGVKAIIAESFERIHRSNLIGMGILPLQFKPGESAESLRLTGLESYDIVGLTGAETAPATATVTADGRSFEVVVRLDTALEAEYYRHGGILDYVMRQVHRRELANA
jgi:aconitate hydratase